ncbi:hypothetical protein TrST_g766 [Triparma strigata]|uniref:EGF-like domain-containing protein n=1 Tax=Triparma strigata TaxID=1606541 RepID=A0A9W7EDB0_9STRA|nr:hypothetical protein TrST_g766 [Triparma strigata]
MYMLHVLPPLLIVLMLLILAYHTVNAKSTCPNVLPQNYYAERDTEASWRPITNQAFPVNEGFAPEQKFLPVDNNGKPTTTPCELYELQNYCLARLNYYRVENPAFSTTVNSPHEYDGKRRNIDKDSAKRRPFKPVNAKMMQCQNEKVLSDLIITYDSPCSHPSYKFSCGQAEFQRVGENSCCKRKCDDLQSCKASLDKCLSQMWNEGKDIMANEAQGFNGGEMVFHYVAMLNPNKEFAACGFGFIHEGGDNYVLMNQAFYEPKDLFSRFDSSSYPKAIDLNDNDVSTMVDKPGVGIVDLRMTDLEKVQGNNLEWTKGPHKTYFKSSWSLPCTDTCSDPSTNRATDNSCISCHGKDYSNANTDPPPATLDCDGVPNGNKVLDACGKCGGNGQSCIDCDGVLNGNKVLDACGECGGNGLSCAPVKCKKSSNPAANGNLPNGRFYCINGGSISGNVGDCRCTNCDSGYWGPNCETALACFATEEPEDDGSDGMFYCLRGEIRGSTGNCRCARCRDGYTGDNCNLPPSVPDPTPPPVPTPTPPPVRTPATLPPVPTPTPPPVDCVDNDTFISPPLYASTRGAPCTYFCESPYATCEDLISVNYPNSPSYGDAVRENCPSCCATRCSTQPGPLNAAALQGQEDEEQQPQGDEVTIITGSDEEKVSSIVFGATFGSIAVVAIVAGVGFKRRNENRRNQNMDEDDRNLSLEDIPLSPLKDRSREVPELA